MSIGKNGIINAGSVWICKYGKVEVDCVSNGEVCFYDDEGRYGEVGYDRFLLDFEPFNIYSSSINFNAVEVEDELNHSVITEELWLRSDKELLFMASVIRLVLDDRGVEYVGRSSDNLKGEADE